MSYLLKLCFAFCTFYCCQALIPSYIPVCNSKQPDLDKCIINSINSLRTKLKEGIPELDVPPLEPLRLQDVKLRRGPNSAQIDANLTNLDVWGPTSFQILEVKPNLAKNKFSFKFIIPTVRFEGDYDIDMNVLVLKYKGKGPITGNFTNLAIAGILKGHKVNRDGDEYLEFEKMKIKLALENPHIRLGNLFHQDPLLARATGDVINDSADLFINEIKPNLESSLADKFTELANKITLKFTYKELFP